MKVGDKVRVGPTTPTLFTLKKMNEITGYHILSAENGYEFEFSGTLYPERRKQQVQVEVDRRKS